MPKRVDHDKRRREITDAVVRIATKGGLGAASFREVAAEAGISVRLIQYYFGTKDELFLWTQRHVAERSTARFMRLMMEAGSEPRDVLRAVLSSFIPTDEESRQAIFMFVVLHTASLVDPMLARDEARDVPGALQALVESQLRRATLDAGIDAHMEAAALVAMTLSLAQAVLDGTYTPKRALAIIDYALGRTFATTGP
jgi:AcrR family transcriptional regulator